MATNVMSGLLRSRCSITIKPAFSRSCSALYLIQRLTPQRCRYPLGSGNVSPFTFHEASNRAIHTSAAPPPLVEALAAASAHHNGTLTNLSAITLPPLAWATPLDGRPT